MAFKVVRFVAEHAFLFRERLELAALRTVPVGGMCVWQGTVSQTLSVSEGMPRKAGKRRRTEHYGDQEEPVCLLVSLTQLAVFNSSCSNIQMLDVFLKRENCKRHSSGLFFFFLTLYSLYLFMNTQFPRDACISSLDVRCYVMASS